MKLSLYKSCHTYPEPMLPPGANVIKPFTAVIYHHSMVLLSIYVIKQYYFGNSYRIAVHYHGKSFIALVICGKLKYNGNLPWYCSNLRWYFNPRKCRYAVVLYNIRTLRQKNKVKILIVLLPQIVRSTCHVLYESLNRK
jgi:hypothetical protein